MVGTSILLLFPYFKEELDFTRQMGCSDKEQGSKTFHCSHLGEEPNQTRPIMQEICSNC